MNSSQLTYVVVAEFLGKDRGHIDGARWINSVNTINQCNQCNQSINQSINAINQCNQLTNQPNPSPKDIQTPRAEQINRQQGDQTDRPTETNKMGKNKIIFQGRSSKGTSRKFNMPHFTLFKGDEDLEKTLEALL
jgi:hypothetical protein